MTLATKLDEYKWRFFEKGMIAVWNELKRLANAANTTQLGSAELFGTISFTTNCDPDVAEQVPKTTAVGYTGSAVYGTSPPTQAQA